MIPIPVLDERIINRIKLTNNVIDFDMSLKGNLIIFSILIRITPNILPTLSIMDVLRLNRTFINNFRSRILTGIPEFFVTENINLMNFNIRRTLMSRRLIFIVGIKSVNLSDTVLILFVVS